MSASTEKSKPADKASKNDKEKKEEVLSEEDQRKKEELELLVTRIHDTSDEGVVKLALETLRSEIRSSTSSMTAIPKPLKFLHPHYETLKDSHAKMPDCPNKASLADIISVLAMTHENPHRECLQYRLIGSSEDSSAWGHEYLRHLSGEISDEFEIRNQNNKPVDDILKLVDEIVPYNVTHNAEPEACDLLLEVEQLDRVLKHVDEHNFQRITLYLISCSQFDEENSLKILQIVHQIYRKLDQLPRAMQIALRLNDKELIKETFNAAKERSMRRQLACMLGRQYLFDIVDMDAEEDSQLVELATNVLHTKYFTVLAKDLQITEPKHPEDIYKTHLMEGKSLSTAKFDSARANLASTIVSAFVNAASGTDKLMTVTDANNVSWVHKNKEHAMLTAAASLGMLYLWDVSSERLSEIDKYLYSSDENIKAGALLGIGIMSSGVRSEFDPALGLLGEYLEPKNSGMLRVSAALGLGLAYAGTDRPEVKEMLMQSLDDSKASMEVLGIHSLALGLVCVGTCDFELTEKLCGLFDGKTETQLTNTYTRFISLGLGLLFLGKKEASEVCVELLKAVAGSIGKNAALTVETLAYAYSGSVVKVQDLLHTCNEHLDKDNEFQAVAVLGIALIAMSDEISSDMALRTFDHLLQYGEVNIRRTVPLALALLCVGNPAITVMDTLSKLSHDHDAEVAMAAIFGLGMIGCGTNNSRIAQLLRQLASYYYKDANSLFMVRIAQGLLHMGKGTISLKPTHSQGVCVNWASLGSLIALVHACLDLKGLILGKAHYLLYLVAPAMQPRWLVTLDEELEPKPVTVRVGQAIDVVGQPGKPKTITGFQTHNTPVLIYHGERAEMATNEFVPVSDILEGLLIVSENPDSKKNKMDVD